jgi:hypothetical protein
MDGRLSKKNVSFKLKSSGAIIEEIKKSPVYSISTPARTYTSGWLVFKKKK